MKKCKGCGTYTLKDVCPSCGGQTISPHPPKFSPEDPYGRYRRMLKRRVLNWVGKHEGVDCKVLE